MDKAKTRKAELIEAINSCIEHDKSILIHVEQILSEDLIQYDTRDSLINLKFEIMSDYDMYLCKGDEMITRIVDYKII